MKKSDLVEKLATETNLSNGTAYSVVNIILETIMESLSNGHRVEIRGFGSFRIKEYDSYTGRNPKTGEPISVKPKKSPAFKAGRELASKVNA